MTIPADRWVNFYSDCFPIEAEAKHFVAACRARADDAPAATELMQHSRRLIMLAEEIARSKPGRDALPILFFIICAEFVAKKVEDARNYGGEKSKKKEPPSHRVQRFFSEFLTDAEKAEIGSAFVAKDGTAFDLRQSVSVLYKVRCEVAHEGVYWAFSFSDTRADADYIPAARSRLTLPKLRDIVKRGCARAALSVLDGGGQEKYLPKPFEHDLERAEIETELVLHRRAVCTRFTPRCPEEEFSNAEWRELLDRGAWLEALSSGEIRPITSRQRRFVDSCAGRVAPSGFHEELWERYKITEAYHRLTSIPSDWYLDEDEAQYEDEDLDDHNVEMEMLRSELDSDADAWASSGEDGWYYDDDDEGGEDEYALYD